MTSRIPAKGDAAIFRGVPHQVVGLRPEHGVIDIAPVDRITAEGQFTHPTALATKDLQALVLPGDAVCWYVPGLVEPRRPREGAAQLTGAVHHVNVPLPDAPGPT